MDTKHNPDAGLPNDELTGALRRAVDAVRTQPMPADADERAVERAMKASTMPVRKPMPWHNRTMLTVMAVAAMLAMVIIIPEMAYRGGNTFSYVGGQVGKTGASSPQPRLIFWSRVIFGKQKAETARIARETSVYDATDRIPRDVCGPDWGGPDMVDPSSPVGVTTKDDATVFYEKRNGVGYSPPARALVVKGGSRIHSDKERPFLTRLGEAGLGKDKKPDPVKIAPKETPPPNEPEGRENYSHFKDNPYFPASTTPLSTFSIAVDTASYSNVRRFLLQEGRLPPADAVRVAEMVNYFPYTYAQPKGEHPVAFTLDLTACPWQPKHHLARIALMGKQIDPKQMPARNLVFLLDTSGSMFSENRLPLLKKSLALLVEQLTPQDRVAMVAYAGQAGLVLPSTSGGDKKTILDALARLESGGSTNGGAGIDLAYQIARANFIKGGVNRVILGTDGDFNVGVTSEGDLVRLIEEQRKHGVFLTILGYGMGNLKDATMERLAHHGHGHFAYIDTLAEAKKIFVEQGASLTAIAKDVKLQVEFNPQLVGAYRLVGYENKLMRDQDFNDDTKHAGVIGSGHTVTALYEIVPAGEPIPVPGVDPLKYQKPARTSGTADGGEWLTVKLRYKDPEADASKKLEQPLTGAVTRLSEAPTDLRFAAAVAEFGLLLRNSEYKGTATYPAVHDLASGALGTDANGHRAEFVKLVEAATKIAAPPKP